MRCDLCGQRASWLDDIEGDPDHGIVMAGGLTVYRADDPQRSDHDYYDLCKGCMEQVAASLGTNFGGVTKDNSWDLLVKANRWRNEPNAWSDSWIAVIWYGPVQVLPPETDLGVTRMWRLDGKGLEALYRLLKSEMPQAGKDEWKDPERTRPVVTEQLAWDEEEARIREAEGLSSEPGGPYVVRIDPRARHPTLYGSTMKRSELLRLLHWRFEGRTYEIYDAERPTEAPTGFRAVGAPIWEDTA